MTVKWPVAPTEDPTDDGCFNVVVITAAGISSRPEQSDLPPSHVMRKYLLMF